MSPAQRLVELVRDSGVVLCVGPGGVGKTTTSAALALAAADDGRRVCVLTIDPARRLADALGVQLGNTPHQVEMPGAKGELWAVMLDPASTLDDLIKRLAPTPARAERMLGNIIYRQMSRALAGTLEYTAIEKLYDLRERHGFDLVVVDTPPSKNVLDFIEAPEWILRFLDERVLKWFALLGGEPTRTGIARAVLKRTAKAVGDVLGKVFGESFVADFGDFVRDLETMTAELRLRARNIQELLRSPECGFVVVTTPDPFVVADAVFLRNELAKRALGFAGFVVNRASVASGLESPEAIAALLTDRIGAELAKKLANTCLDIDARAKEDAAVIGRLRREAHWNGYVGVVPREIEEIHDLASLRTVGAHF